MYCGTVVKLKTFYEKMIFNEFNLKENESYDLYYYRIVKIVMELLVYFTFIH